MRIFWEKAFYCFDQVSFQCASKNSLKNEIQRNTNITILIGPEGDFSTHEINKAIAKDFIPVMLGETRLRTETAAIVACHSVIFSNS